MTGLKYFPLKFVNFIGIPFVPVYCRKPFGAPNNPSLSKLNKYISDYKYVPFDFLCERRYLLEYDSHRAASNRKEC